MWALGALLAIFGSVATNFGVNVQKHSQNLNAKKPKLQQQFYYKQKLYLVGLALVILGSLGDFAALSMAAQSIVAPLGSVTLVTNIIFAKYFLKEQLGRKDLIGTVGIIIGSVLAVAFGDHAEVSYTVQQLLSFYGRGAFIAFAIITVLMCGVGYVFVRNVNPLKQRLNDAFEKYDHMVMVQDRQLSGDVTDDIAHEGVVTDDDIDYQNSIIECLELDYKRYEKLHPFALCALSGVLGGWSVMFGKMVAECLSTTFAGDSQLGQPVLYLFALCMLGTITGQLNFLAIALGYFDALYCVPIFQCFWIMTSTFGGACYFNEFASFSAVQWVFFPIGIIVTIAGVVVLSTRNMTTRTSETHLKHDSSQMQQLHAANALDTLDEVDELDDAAAGVDEDGNELSSEDRLKRQLKAIQQKALYAAEALDRTDVDLYSPSGAASHVIEMTDVTARVNQYNTDIMQKVEHLRATAAAAADSSDEPSKHVTFDVRDEESKEQEPPQYTPSSRTSPIRRSNDVNDYSPNSRVRQLQQQAQQQQGMHRRSRSGSVSPHMRRSIDDTANVPDSPLHRVVSYLANTYAASAGAVHASDYVDVSGTNNDDLVQASPSKQSTPTHARTKSVKLVDEFDDLA